MLTLDKLQTEIYFEIGRIILSVVVEGIKQIVGIESIYSVNVFETKAYYNPTKFINGSIHLFISFIVYGYIGE